MITLRNGLLALDNLGWVDGGRLWAYDLTTKAETMVKVPGAKYLPLSKGEGDFFRVVHRGDPGSRISVRTFQDPSTEVAAVHKGKGGFEFIGDATVWACVECAAIVDDQQIIRIDWRAREVRSLELDWFNSEAFDLGYQGLIDCLSLPDQRQIVVSVQRSSDLFLIDRDSGALKSAIRLGEFGGGGNLQLLSETSLLATDYDALCLVDLNAARLSHRTTLQRGRPPLDRQFIGGYALTGTGLAAVARPFSGDIALVDLDTLQVSGEVVVGGQPLSVGWGAHGTLVSRDWKTGEVREVSSGTIN